MQSLGFIGQNLLVLGPTTLQELSILARQVFVRMIRNTTQHLFKHLRYYDKPTLPARKLTPLDRV